MSNTLIHENSGLISIKLIVGSCGPQRMNPAGFDHLAFPLDYFTMGAEVGSPEVFLVGHLINFRLEPFSNVSLHTEFN